MYKAAIIGAGHIALDAHIPAYLSLDGQVQVISAGTRSIAKNAQRLKEYGIRTIYERVDEMLEKEHPDVVSVCTPNASHADYTAMALEAGADVLCEKPVAMTLAEAEKLYALAAEKGCHLMACQTIRFQPAWQKAKAVVDAGLLGDIYSAEAKWVRRRGIPTWGNFHIREENGGGALCDLGVHILDALFWLTGTKKLHSVRGTCGSQLKEALPASAWDYKRGGHFKPEEMDVEEWSLGSLETDTGVAASFHFAWATNGPAARYLLLNGTKGSLSVPDLIFYPAEGEPYALECEKAVSPAGHREMMRQFFAAKSHGRPLPILPEETLLVTKTIEEIYQNS